VQGSYFRVGDVDKPMSEYEVYSYEAYRKKYRDDLRPAERVSLADLDAGAVQDYVARRKPERPNFSAIASQEHLYNLLNLTQNGQVTLSSVLLFSPYPQAYYPQLCIIATCVPGTEMGVLGEDSSRFIDSKRIEGTLPGMLEDAMAFVHRNMRIATHIDPKTGRR